MSEVRPCGEISQSGRGFDVWVHNAELQRCPYRPSCCATARTATPPQGKGACRTTHLLSVARLISDVHLYSHETRLNVNFWNNISSPNFCVLQQLGMPKDSACDRLTAPRVKQANPRAWQRRVEARCVDLPDMGALTAVLQGAEHWAEV